jgi:transcriptional regulator with XRE-family HTH domain
MSKKDRSVSCDFGKYIKQLREAKGLMIKDIAARSGISESYIYRLENGERKVPSVVIIEKLAVALGVPASQLFNIAIS